VYVALSEIVAVWESQLVMNCRGAGNGFLPLLKSEWAVWRVEGGREPGAANP